MAIARAELLEAVSNMTVLELSTLIKEMEEKFGVSAAAAVAVAAPAAAAAAPAAEEQTDDRPGDETSDMGPDCHAAGLSSLVGEGGDSTQEL